MIPSVPAPCPHFELCGGCQFQDIPPSFYQHTKINSVTQALGALVTDSVTMHDPVFIPQATRRRVSFVARLEKDHVSFGFHQKKSHMIVDVTTCLLLTPRLEKLRASLRDYLPRILTDHHPCDIFLQEAHECVEMVITGTVRSSDGAPDTAFITYVAKMAHELDIARIGWRARDTHPVQPVTVLKNFHARFAALDVDLPFQSFLQPSSEGENFLVDTVLSFLPKTKKLRAADLFCGCGTFTAHLLPRVSYLYAAESDVHAVNALRVATKSFAHIKVEQRDLEKEPLTLRELKNLDVVVFDPPRAGAKALAQRLAQSIVPVVIGVSCNPQSFARDAQSLIRGGYKLTDVKIIDQFIWSSHVELVARFQK